MSLSLISWYPLIEEPSNPYPSVKESTSSYNSDSTISDDSIDKIEKNKGGLLTSFGDNTFFNITRKLIARNFNKNNNDEDDKEDNKDGDKECGENTDVAIIDLGASNPGEIEYICNIALPDMGIITNIYEAHLEYFGDIQEVARTKSGKLGKLQTVYQWSNQKKKCFDEHGKRA